MAVIGIESRKAREPFWLAGMERKRSSWEFGLQPNTPLVQGCKLVQNPMNYCELKTWSLEELKTDPECSLRALSELKKTELFMTPTF